MNLNLIDNPVWHALNSYHRHLAIRGEIAARYQPDIFIVSAMPENSRSGFDDLRNLVEVDELIAVIGKFPKDLVGWEIGDHFPLSQMICENLKSSHEVEAIRLTIDDVPDMLDLITIAQPGPFLSRTIELGEYLGLFQNGQLVAMAGERMHFPGFCEVSAVCTHPDFRGRGYGRALTAIVAENIVLRGEVPFLHVALTNEIAKNLYQKLGFRLRAELQLAILRRIA